MGCAGGLTYFHDENLGTLRHGARGGFLMILDRVTITGADDSIHVEQLAELSQAYPYVEWGILVSAWPPQ